MIPLPVITTLTIVHRGEPFWSVHCGAGETTTWSGHFSLTWEPLSAMEHRRATPNQWTVLRVGAGR